MVLLQPCNLNALVSYHSGSDKCADGHFNKAWFLVDCKNKNFVYLQIAPQIE